VVPVQPERLTKIRILILLLLGLQLACVVYGNATGMDPYEIGRTGGGLVPLIIGAALTWRFATGRLSTHVASVALAALVIVTWVGNLTDYPLRSLPFVTLPVLVIAGLLAPDVRAWFRRPRR
jgi:hypothetical protein